MSFRLYGTRVWLAALVSSLLFVASLADEPIAASSLPPVGSLPPLSTADKQPSSIPTHLLPSSNKIIEAPSLATDDPRARRSCAFELQRVKQIHGSTLSGGLTGFKALYNLLRDDHYPPKLKHTPPARVSTNALHMIFASFTESRHTLQQQIFIGLANCAVDNKGRTILMKLVKQGLAADIPSGVVTKFAGGDVMKLKDMDGNNLLHLAAMSGSQDEVDFVLDLLGSDSVQAMMETNTAGQTPQAVAVESGLEDPADSFNRAADIHRHAPSLPAVQLDERRSPPAVP